MSNGYKKSDTALFIRNVMLGMKKMKAELNEHRYCLERNVERRSEHLLKRIALLESCNSTLSGKLALAQKEIAALKQRPAHPLQEKDTEQNDRTVKLYVMNNPTQKPVVPNVHDKWGEHATAA